MRVLLEVHNLSWGLLCRNVAAQNDTLALDILSKELDVWVLELARLQAVM